MKNEVLKTGTTTLGIVCKDGVVLAADKRATAGHMIVDKRTNKVLEITPKIAITTAGSVSDIQLLAKLLKAELNLKMLRTNREITIKESANLLSGMVYKNIRQFSSIPGVSHFLLGGADTFGTYLYDCFPDGSLTKIDDFVSSGSGSVFAYGVLETLYTENISVDKGVELALKAINAALQRDSASGNGVDVMVITKDKMERVISKRIETSIN